MTSFGQFSADDERIGHQRLLDNIRAQRVRELDAIRAEKIKNEPEPDHEPECSRDSIKAWGSLQTVDTFETWCCEWHQYHSQEDK